MFVSKKEHDELKKRVEELEKLTGNLMHNLIEVQKKIEEDNKTTYFG